MFDKATRLKLRFDTSKGSISTEDLWDMPLTSPTSFCLDELAKSLHQKLKESGKKSFVYKKTRKDSIVALKLDIVKHIIEYKMDVAAKNEQAAVNRDKREKIKNAIAEIEENSLKNESLSSLKKMLKELS